MNFFKSIIYRGIPYISFGYGSMFTSRNYSINKVWYLWDGWRFPVLLKTRHIGDMWEKPFRQFVIDAIEQHDELVIEKEYFNDRGETVAENKSDMFLYSVYAENKFGKFYMGNIHDAYSRIKMYDFRTYDNSTSGTACVASTTINGTKHICGWSHRAMVCFTKGDKIFTEDYGNDKTIYKKHGEHEIKTDADMLLSARNFASDVA